MVKKPHGTLALLLAMRVQESELAVSTQSLCDHLMRCIRSSKKDFEDMKIPNWVMDPVWIEIEVAFQ
ncbi:hypothetical protein T4E_7400 [Trichinella pseudospiralis]|uniref:Uncharacterized protein n=1 Tax=Trichinella pseudospiralis TaxID=6337 RepID=A0A0V0XLJ1_TRIPS|nr:hypothetical protein T4E_7400 [Trichinella pseudospiralis]